MKLRKKYTPGAYDKCIVCQFRGHGCDGPRTTSMSVDRWCMLMRRLKEEAGYTNEEVADGTGISLKTVQKIMAGSVETDLRASTMTAIEGFLFGTSGTYPCPLELIPEQEATAALKKELAEALEELENAKRALEDMRVAHHKELDAVRADAQKKIDYLKLENDRKSAMIDKLLKD